MGKYPKDRRGTAQDERSALIFALPPVPYYEGYPLGQAKNFRRVKPGVLGCGFFRPHWGPGFAKFASGALPVSRLSLPNQRSGSVFRCRGGPCGRPNAFHSRSRLEKAGRKTPKKESRRPAGRFPAGRQAHINPQRKTAPPRCIQTPWRCPWPTLGRGYTCLKLAMDIAKVFDTTVEDIFFFFDESAS